MNNNGKNNNNNNREAATDANIITKKGFLISLPGRKKNAAAQSSINMTGTPKAEAPKAVPTPVTQQNPDKQNAGGKQADKRFGKPRFDRNKNKPSAEKTSDNKKQDAGGQNNSKPQNGGNTAKPRQTFKPEGDKNGQNLQNVPNRPRNDRRPRNNNRDRVQNGQNGQGGQPNQVQNQADNKPKLIPNLNGQNVSGQPVRNNQSNQKREVKQFPNRNENKKGDNRRPRNNNNNNSPEREAKQAGEKVTFRPNRNEKRTPKTEVRKPMAPLSALSGDLAAFDAKKQEFEQVQAGIKVPEISLEEKYKDALPLAEQIAAEENARRGARAQNGEASEKQEIVGIRFREAGKIYYFDPEGQKIDYGTPVVVETARGSEYGFTAIANRLIPSESIVSPLKKIQRIATEMDTQKYVANKALEKQGEEVFREKVEKLGLEMNLIYVEYTFDNSKLLFYFTAETRIDFRELVKELAGVFRTRIELRQIGVRDEAKVLGGLGVCGRVNCCSTFLGDFAQVSIKMAKDQSLSLNAAKISGACGKLMCCLRYEDKVYEEENRLTPKVGAIVETADGKGTVTERNTLKGTVNVVLDNAPDVPSKVFKRDDVTIVGFGKTENEHVDDNADEIKDAE